MYSLEEEGDGSEKDGDASEDGRGDSGVELKEKREKERRGQRKSDSFDRSTRERKWTLTTSNI